jgi:hypothetical protein
MTQRAVRLAKHGLILELNIYKNLARWGLRRPSVPAGFEPVAYSRMVTPVMALWIFASALELPLVHVLVPWHGLRIALLVVGVWGLLWMLGVLAGLRTYPHLLGRDVVRIRNGALHDIAVPWSAIAKVTTEDRSLPSSVWTLQQEERDDGDHLNVAVSGRVNVHLALRDRLAIRTRNGDMTVTGVSLWADEPREVAARIRSELEPQPRRG